MYQQPVVIVKSSSSPPDRYERLLAKFTSQRICTSGTNAMQIIESAPAHIAIIEDQLDDMQAADLAEMIRDVDDELGHFTYIIVVGEAFAPAIGEAFTEHVDAFVSVSDIDRLAAVAAAGARISDLVNDVVENNAQLECEREVLLAGQLLDPLTGLGNRKMAVQTLEDCIAQVESRGGAVCLILVSVENRLDIIKHYDDRIANELIQGIAERLNSTVRPMDTVTYFEDGLFALILVQPSIEHCTAACYQRIFDSVRLKSYRTSVGYLETTIGMSICASHTEHGPPLPDRMIQTARDELASAARLQQINVTRLAE